jgi:hypothetical protein
MSNKRKLDQVSNASTNPKLRKIRGLGPKIRGYLKKISPEVQDASGFLQAYPNMEPLIAAIMTSEGSEMNNRRQGSLRSNLTRAYEWMNSTPLSTTPKPTTNAAVAMQNAADHVAAPADLVRTPINESTILAEPILDQIAEEKDMDTPFGRGKETAPTGEGVENTRDPVPSYSQRLQNHPNVSALTVEKALDLAEINPIKPTKELATLPTFADNAILTQQEEYYLEHKNSNSIAQSTIGTPAAAITTNNGDGVREGIRRRDTDVDVANELMEQQAEENLEGQSGPQKGGGSSKKNQRMEGPPAGAMESLERRGQGDRLIRSMQWLGRGLGTLSSQVGQQIRRKQMHGQMREAKELQKEYVEAHAADIDPATNVAYTPAQLKAQARAAHPYNTVSNQFKQAGLRATIDVAADVASGVAGIVEKFKGSRDLMIRAKAKGIPAEEVERYIREVGEAKQTLQGELKGDTEDTDELRPFLAVAGASNVELAPGDNQQKKRTEALFADYKPPNWPLGATDNLLHLHNLILKGIHWMSPLDAIPPVLQGGSLLQGVHEYSDYVPAPSSDELDFLAIAKQMRYKLEKTGERIIWRNLLDTASTFREEIVRDVKFLFNPMAMGADTPQVFTPNELNPLCTPMHLDLRVGGSEPLRNLYGPCDAWSIMSQPGFAKSRPPEQTYMQGSNFNLYSTRPGYH